MGCDIHIVIQCEETPGAWREIPYQALFGYEGEPSPIDGFAIAPDVFRNRNYDLFGILADVRNGRGFAGIQTSEPWPSIASHRGLPDGFNEATVLPDPRWPEEGPRSLGDHSFTWVTLEEIRAFPWDATVVTQYGCVPAAKYQELTAIGDTPDSYSGDVTGPDIRVYSPSDYVRGQQLGELVKKPYVRMSWPESARSATNDWPGKVIPWLDSLADGKPLRLVLGFNS